MKYSTVTVNRYSSLEERQSALYQIYNQVLERQPYVYEHRALAKAEKDFLRDKIGVKRFLKILGESDVYLNEFYYNSSNLKFLELCFKHFMGRAPYDHGEMQDYSDTLARSGVHGLITKMLDSEEYRKHFGCFTVPHAAETDHYPSPKAYLENNFLNHELHGQRGHAVPTMLWYELGLTCDGGNCRVPEQLSNVLTAAAIDPDRLELLQVLRRIHPDDLKEIVSSLPTNLRNAISA